MNCGIFINKKICMLVICVSCSSKNARSWKYQRWYIYFINPCSRLPTSLYFFLIHVNNISEVSLFSILNFPNLILDLSPYIFLEVVHKQYSSLFCFCTPRFSLSILLDGFDKFQRSPSTVLRLSVTPLRFDVCLRLKKYTACMMQAFTP